MLQSEVEGMHRLASLAASHPAFHRRERQVTAILQIEMDIARSAGESGVGFNAEWLTRALQISTALDQSSGFLPDHEELLAQESTRGE